MKKILQPKFPRIFGLVPAGRFQLLSLLNFFMIFSGGLPAQQYHTIDEVNGNVIYFNSPEDEIYLYDSGGAGGEYQNNEDFEVTICTDFELAGCPPPPPIFCIFNYIDIEPETNCGYDWLQVDGGDFYCNGNYPPLYGLLDATSYTYSENGCLTINFHSDISIVRDGFELRFIAQHPFETSSNILSCSTQLDASIFNGAFGGLGNLYYYECGGDQYGPYDSWETKYNIEAEGLVTLTIDGNVDFFVYGLSTNQGPNGCPPITSIGCAVGNDNSISFNADDYPYGIWVIVDGNTNTDYHISLQCNGPCQTCDHCFAFLTRYQSANIIDFQNRYCGGDVNFTEDQTEHRSMAFTYEWSVPNANELYTSGTNSASENPSIIFPGAGTYTVCQKVYSGSSVVFECCHTVFIGPCTTPPIAYFTASLGAFDRYVLNTNGNGNNLQWTFSDPDVFFFQGDEHSNNPVIVTPYQECVTVCLYETNACGTSSYCLELCLNNPTCPGNNPPTYITNEIQPFVEGQNVEISLPNPPSGGQATYSWDFGDGTTATTKNIIHTFPEFGNYNVCVVVTVGCRTWCYCWCIHLHPCTPVYTYNSGDIEVEFTGSENVFQYSFTASSPKAPGENWLVNGTPVSSNSNTLVYTFPSAGNYTVCFPYLGTDGCVHYYCVDIYAGNPFACNSITWQFNANNGYRFTIPSGSTDIQWSIDETGQAIGQSSTSNWVLPVNPCGWKTISVRYFDGFSYRICCLRIYLCPPDECYSSIDYGYLASTNQATFKLNTSGNNDITWYFDDAPTQTLGTGQSLVIPYPGTCISRWISAKYKDNAGRWRICCRLIYFCNPLGCDIIQANYNANNGYSFTVDKPQENMSWIVEETQTSLGNSQTSNYLTIGSACEYRTVSLRYWIPGFGWTLCCIRIYWCDPTACGDNISFSTSNGALVLSAPDYLQNITWFKDGTKLGTSNPQTTGLSANTSHIICLRYLDLCDNSWKWCCRNYTPGGTSAGLIFDFDNKVCGSQNQIVEVPLRVKGFTNLKNFQFSINLEDSLKGRLLEITSENITGDFEAYVANAVTGRVFWESANNVTIGDNVIIAKARIRILSNSTGESRINITGSPIPIYVEDGAGNQVIPIVREGSFCFENLVSVCGRITREDNVPIPNVVLSLNGCKQFESMTDNNGQYCFDNIPAGSSYEIRASRDTNYKNGVNTGDLSAIKRHILGTVILNTPYRILAGDGKKSNGINTGDISELRRLIQGVLTDLPTCESWEFMDKKYVFSNPDNPFSEVRPQGLTIQNLQQDILDADWIGWKMGDVNVSNNPAAVTGSPDLEGRSVNDLYLSLSSTKLPEADEFFLDVTTRQFEDVLNGSFSIQFDPEKFELTGITHQHPALQLGGDEIVINPSGSMVFVWESSSGVSLPDSSTLFSLMFIPKVSKVDLSEVTFSNEPAEIYFEKEDGEILNVITTNGSINVPVQEILPEQLTISPNPAEDWVSVRLRLDAPSKVEVMLYNEMGVQVDQMNSNNESLTLFSGKLDLSKLPTGLYFLKVSNESASVTRKIIHF